jgi:hypothetical protein
MPQGLADRIAAIFFRILRDGTGVEYEQVRRFSEWDDVVAVASQHIAEHGCLCLIETAAQCVEGCTGFAGLL